MSAANVSLDLKAKLERDRVWTTLRLHNAHVAWNPDQVDEALNLADPSLSFPAICQQVAASCTRPQVVAASELVRPTGELMFRWLHAQVHRRVFVPERREDGVSVLFNIVARAIEKYQPSRFSGGRWHTQGFASYLYLRARSLHEQTAIATDSCGQVALDPLLDENLLPKELTVQYDRYGDVELRTELIEGLRATLDSRTKWDCVLAMSYLQRSLRDVASEQRIPRSTLSRNIAKPIIHGLQSALRIYFVEGRSRTTDADLGTITDAVRSLLSLDEFRDFIPRPENVGHSTLPPECNTCTPSRRRSDELPVEDGLSSR